MADAISPFDFIKSVSHNKKDLILDNPDVSPEDAEKAYNPYMVNRGLSYFQDTILHANEMNINHQLSNDAQYRYYLGALRPRQRFSKWYKSEKDADLDLIQQEYQCNRTVAKFYARILTPENLNQIRENNNVGG